MFLHLLSQEREKWRTLLQEEQARNNDREIRSEHERERLLNRAMTQKWTDFVQVEGTRNQGTFASQFEPSVGMSDEEEERRYREQMAAALVASQGTGIGEVADDLNDDARDLGLAPEFG